MYWLNICKFYVKGSIFVIEDNFFVFFKDEFEFKLIIFIMIEINLFFVFYIIEIILFIFLYIKIKFDFWKKRLKNFGFFGIRF